MMAIAIQIMAKKHGEFDASKLTEKQREELNHIYEKVMRMDIEKIEKEGPRIAKQLEDLRKQAEKKP
jgi:uncharacterized protein YfkK (UPF0435 family)